MEGGRTAPFLTRCCASAWGGNVAFPATPICKSVGFGSLSRGRTVRSFPVNCSFQTVARASRVNIFLPREQRSVEKKKEFRLPAKLRLAIVPIGILGFFLRNAWKHEWQNGPVLFSSAINAAASGHHVCAIPLRLNTSKSPLDIRTDALCNSASGIFGRCSRYAWGSSNCATRAGLLIKLSGPAICLKMKLADQPAAAQQQQVYRFLLEEVVFSCAESEFGGSASGCCVFCVWLSATGHSNWPRANGSANCSRINLLCCPFAGNGPFFAASQNTRDRTTKGFLRVK